MEKVKTDEPSFLQRLLLFVGVIPALLIAAILWGCAGAAVVVCGVLTPFYWLLTGGSNLCNWVTKEGDLNYFAPSALADHWMNTFIKSTGTGHWN